MDLAEEKELVERAKSDLEAFGPLYDYYYPRIFGYVLRRTANLAVAQDITSEVFLKAVRNLWRFDWIGISLSSWLYRIANHEISNYYRLNGHWQVSSEIISNSINLLQPDIEEEVLEAEAKLERYESFLALHQNIRRLPAKYQEVITLRFLEQKQLKEISAILGKSQGTVKSLLHRGLKRLRVLMD